MIKTLFGHSSAVKSVWICREYSIIVSGDESGQCIVWDLNKYIKKMWVGVFFFTFHRFSLFLIAFRSIFDADGRPDHSLHRWSNEWRHCNSLFERLQYIICSAANFREKFFERKFLKITEVYLRYIRSTVDSLVLLKASLKFVRLLCLRLPKAFR